MTSVPDPPGDKDDDASGVSPELVLIDPALARRLREERPPEPEQSPSASHRILRLVPQHAAESLDGMEPRPALPPWQSVPVRSRADVDGGVARALDPFDAPEPAPAPAAPPWAPPVPAESFAEPVPDVDAAVAHAGGALDGPTPAPAEPPSDASRGEFQPTVEAAIETHSVVDAPARVVEPGTAKPPGHGDAPSAMPHPVARPAAVGGARGPRRSRRGRRALALAVTVAVASAAVVAATRLSDVSLPGLRRDAKQPAPPPGLPQPVAASGASRTLAWAPVEGAVSYRVVMFKGGERVLALTTSKPRLDLGSTWRYRGTVVSLTPGTYRWSVWPVTASGRAARPVVRSSLTVR